MGRPSSENPDSTGPRDAADRLPANPADTVVVLNPTSGNGEHDALRNRARGSGFSLVETRREGDAEGLSAAAASAGVERIVAAGGDGTVNGVVQGIANVGALDQVVLGVLPAGTGNNFATNLGLGDLPTAFEALETGPVRRLDLGTGGTRVFVNSCIGGLTAEASGETTSEMKARYGVFAYVLATLRTMVNFDSMPLSVSADGAGGVTESWSGEAMFVLVGNARRFPLSGPTTANAEDGLLDVTIIERQSASELLQDAALTRTFGSHSDSLVQLQATRLAVTVRNDREYEFSFDGEMASLSRLSLGVRTQALRIHVGPEYEPGGPGEDESRSDDDSRAAA